MFYFLAILPILSLIIISLTQGVKKAALISFILTTIIFFYWGAPVNYYFATMISSFISTFNILLIITGAIFLYEVMNKGGLVSDISKSLDGLHPSKEIRFYLIAIALTAFFEGVAGFGTPGAIVPLILISLGYSPILSVSVVLLLDGLFAAFGAVGTPMYAGLVIPLELSLSETALIERFAAIILAITGYLIMFFIIKLHNKEGDNKYQKEIFLMYSFFAIPFVIFSFFAGELTTILAAVAMVIISILFFYRKGRRVELKPWLPYGLLIILMLLPKIILPLRDIITIPLSFDNIFGSDISSEIRLLQSPLIPFLIVGAGVVLFMKKGIPDLKGLGLKVITVLIVLFPTIAIAQMMLHSGVTQPSMVTQIAMMFSALGGAYTFFAPFIGIAGAFITGSTTVSNIIFGPSQLETATNLSLRKEVILSLQHSGAALGNAICLFNIIAAASVVGLKTYKEVLRNNMIPCLAGGVLIGILGIILLMFIS
jgi:lactate permease